MIVAGIMSGTSADGVDVAITRISRANRTITYPKVQLLAHESFAFPAVLRESILTAMDARITSTAELAHLNWRLGLIYGSAVTKTLKRHPVKLDLIGCHGQTLYHQAELQPYAGKRFACTWQLGEASVIAAETGVPVVSNFRPADMAAGGQGAPLVPLLDYVFFNDPKRGRVLQNIGGIANLSVIPAAAKSSDCIAFDSGPGNMVIDALMQQLYDRPYDKNGIIASRGKVLPTLLSDTLKHPFFRKSPPKTAGREQFGREFAANFLAQCRKLSRCNEDAISTATALTSASITLAYRRFCSARMPPNKVDYIVSGGGTRNATLMRQLSENLAPFNCSVSKSDAHGLPAEAKEATAFALLAWQTWHQRSGNLPSATGARRPAILGQISYA